MERLQTQLAALRSGRASAGMLDRIQACLCCVQLQGCMIGCCVLDRVHTCPFLRAAARVRDKHLHVRHRATCPLNVSTRGHGQVVPGTAVKFDAALMPFICNAHYPRCSHAQAEAYGERMPLSALATTLVRDPQLLVVNVFDPAVRPKPCTFC